MVQQRAFSLTRPAQWAVGLLVGLAGLGLLGFGLLLIYVDWIRGPSTEILYGTLLVSLMAGTLLTLVGWRLVSNRPSPLDPWLLSASVWRMVALVFLAFGVLLLVRGALAHGSGQLGLCRAVSGGGPGGGPAGAPAGSASVALMVGRARVAYGSRHPKVRKDYRL